MKYFHQKLLNKIKNRQQCADDMAMFVERIKKNPLLPENHADLADFYYRKKKYIESLALFKNAQFLSDDREKLELQIVKNLQKIGVFGQIKKRINSGRLAYGPCQRILEKIEGKSDDWRLEAQGYGKYFLQLYSKGKRRLY